MVEILKYLNEIGLWSFLMFLLALTAWIAGLRLIVFPRKRIRDLNFCFFLTTVENSKYLKSLNVLIRNQANASIIISSPYIILNDRSIANPFADNNSASNEFELKFQDHQQYFTEAQVLIPPGKTAGTFLPLNDEIDLEKISQHSRKKAGNFICNVILLGEKPQAMKCKTPLINIQNRSKQTENY